jgi:regulator of RNase E activity RraA
LFFLLEEIIEASCAGVEFRQGELVVSDEGVLLLQEERYASFIVAHNDDDELQELYKMKNPLNFK